MKLYHGTTAQVAERALVEGLKTRRSTGHKSQWAANPSHPGAVYLTDAYALYFALHTLKDPKDGDRIGVVEVDATGLDALVPDEDVLEQVGRMKGDQVGGNLATRTRWYRKRLHQYQGAEQWKQSIAAMGTVAHLGDIPPQAVTRVALVDPQKQYDMMATAMDPTITVMNYLIVGQKYRDLMDRLWQGGNGITILTH